MGIMYLVLVVCVFLVTSPVSGVVDPAVKRLCPPDAVAIVGDYHFRVYKNICFLFVTYDKAIYHSALRKCQQHGGTLAMPKTKEINDFLLLQLQKMDKNEPVWIGMHDKASEGTMVWEDGEPVGWDNFDWGIHGLFGGGEDCIALNPRDRKWHDYRCARPWLPGFSTSHLKPFICQYTL